MYAYIIFLYEYTHKYDILVWIWLCILQTHQCAEHQAACKEAQALIHTDTYTPKCIHTYTYKYNYGYRYKYKYTYKDKNIFQITNTPVRRAPGGVSGGASSDLYEAVSLPLRKSCVAVCCRVLQGVAVCCSVLQCVAVCCSVLQCVAVCCSVLQCVAVCCSVIWVQIYTRLWVRRGGDSALQCVAVCCSVLQFVAVYCSVIWGQIYTGLWDFCWRNQKSHSPALQSVAECCSALQSVAKCCSVLQCVAVWSEFRYIRGCESAVEKILCCSVLQCVAVCCSALQCVTVRCSVLQCVAVWFEFRFIQGCESAVEEILCCSVLQCVAVCCSVLQCDLSSDAYKASKVEDILHCTAL